VVYYPFDVLRTRLQVNRGGTFTISSTLNLARNLGWRGLYRGFVPYSVGSLPPHATYFISYNIFKDYLQEFDNKYIKKYFGADNTTGKQALWVSFTAGALADIASNVFVVPMEVVGQRLQIQDAKSSKS